MTEPGLATSLVLPCDFSQKSLPSGAFFSLRCLIYKVHAVPGGTLLILQNLIEFVKYFFQKFLMFSTQFCTFSNFFKLPQSARFVKNFFRKFSTLFAVNLSGNFRQVTTLCGCCQVFFLPLSGAVLTAPTALLEYQTVRQKSTLFLALCLLFLRRLSFFLIFGIYLTASLI